MRQLDLFSSLFDTVPDDNKQEEKVPVLKKENDSLQVAEATTSYSMVELAEEMLKGDDLEFVNKASEQNKQTFIKESSISQPLVISEGTNVESTFKVGSNGVETIAIEDKQALPEQIVQPLKSRTSQTKIIEKKNEDGLIYLQKAEEAETSVVGEITVTKKRSSPPPKKINAPELGGNGSVIFDDGKITVKIKSRPSDIQEAPKEKKARIKKPPQKRGRKSFKEIDAEIDLIEVPEDEILFQKQYYSISEVAKWFRVNNSLLRFWENEFDVLKPRKNRKGDRLFRPEDVKNLQLIYQLLRQRKYTVEGAKEYIKTNKKKADIQLQLTNTLQKFRSFLLDLKANLHP